jgi:hypothetical protein
MQTEFFLLSYYLTKVYYYFYCFHKFKYNRFISYNLKCYVFYYIEKQISRTLNLSATNEKSF